MKHVGSMTVYRESSLTPCQSEQKLLRDKGNFLRAVEQKLLGEEGYFLRAVEQKLLGEEGYFRAETSGG